MLKLAAYPILPVVVSGQAKYKVPSRSRGMNATAGATLVWAFGTV